FALKANGGKFTDGNGHFTDEIILEGKFGTPLGYPANFRPQSPVLDENAENDGSSLATDFDFKEWHVGTNMPAATELPATFPAENSIYAARWTQNNGLYKVIHWAESMDKKADGSGYKLLVPNERDGFSGEMLEGSVTKKGKLGNQMVYFHDPVTGFETPTVEYKYTDDRTIKADGKAEVIVTYLRKTYAIRFHLNAGDDPNADWYGTDKGSGETVTRTGKYRTDFTPPANPIRTHFIFRGWVTDPSKTLADRVDIVPSFTESAPKDYYAVWYSKASGGLEIDTPDITLSCSVNGTEIVANVGTPEGAGVWTYSWTVNNASVSETGKVLTLSDCYKKDYEITVVAKHNGKVYTKTEIVTVTGE
ncbi:hypothetical protein, partial [Treponema sp.]|uniref:hypothetical protein n=1 Tax=Treponema sp. TaxID=166 RepID=UPI00298DBDDB